jgi:hypothetical protein
MPNIGSVLANTGEVGRERLDFVRCRLKPRPRTQSRGRASQLNEGWLASAGVAYELLSMCARSSAIEPNLTVPCGSLASIDPSA